MGLAIPLFKIYLQEVLHISKYSWTKMVIVKMCNLLINWKLTKFPKTESIYVCYMGLCRRNCNP